MKQIIVILSFLCISTLMISQKQNNIWYFGNRAGLDFNKTPPTSIEGELVAIEGTASISDPAGHLLFYTDGITIWDRNHNIMPNGTGLLGGESSTQAALIVPLPKSNNKYYVFTTMDYLTLGGMHYSIVDMSLNGGFGDVISDAKNIMVVDKVGEKVTGILHSNGIDIWIVTHKLGSNEFLAYLLTSAGLSMAPVISAIGSIHSTFDPIGPIRNSHSGNQIICCSTYENILEIFDFNKNTGDLSNAIDLYHLFNSEQFIYGIEFSPNDSLLYLASNHILVDYIFQVQLATNQLEMIVTSTEDNFGAIQLGPDNRIYIAYNHSQYLDIIDKPNIPGIGCHYQANGIELKKGTFSWIGLPNPAPYSSFLDSTTYSLGRDTVLCAGDSIKLALNYSIHCDSINYMWSDGSTGSELLVKNTGTYWLEVTSPCLHFRDTIHVGFIPCQPIIQYDLNACRSVMSEGSQMDYTEFVPTYPTSLNCAEISAHYLYRDLPQENKHSCTPGINNSPAMCVTTFNSCTYLPGNSASVVIEFTINPSLDSVVQFTGLEFYEKGPASYNWINGPTGPNNNPQYYGIRILKNGIEIYEKKDIPTSSVWSLQTYDFLNDTLFNVEGHTDFRIELLSYCPIGNGAEVSAWDLDEIKIYGGCVKHVENPFISGHVLTKTGKAISNVEISLSEYSDFSASIKEITDSTGYYSFKKTGKGPHYFIKGYKNDNVMHGVSTLDLICIQKHLLGIAPFTSLHQYIAADINRNGNVSSIDIVELRKVILGINTEFPGNTSWRFGALPQSMTGTDISTFRELKNLEYITNDTQVVNFIGIKVGDVNGSIH